MKRKKTTSLHEKAVILCEGGIVHFNGFSIKAKEVYGQFDACNECEMDSACDKNMQELCCECDGYTSRQYMLVFAKPNK